MSVRHFGHRARVANSSELIAQQHPFLIFLTVQVIIFRKPPGLAAAAGNARGADSRNVVGADRDPSERYKNARAGGGNNPSRQGCEEQRPHLLRDSSEGQSSRADFAAALQAATRAASASLNDATAHPGFEQSPVKEGTDAAERISNGAQDARSFVSVPTPFVSLSTGVPDTISPPTLAAIATPARPAMARSGGRAEHRCAHQRPNQILTYH
jgi:hypothetical protein